MTSMAGPMAAAAAAALSLDPADVAVPKRSHKSLPERAEKLANGDPLAAHPGRGARWRQQPVPSPETLERLVNLAEHVADRQAKAAYARAFVALQAKLLPVTPTSTSTFGPYATLGDIMANVQQAAGRRGLLAGLQPQRAVGAAAAGDGADPDDDADPRGRPRRSSEVSIIVEVGPVSASAPASRCAPMAQARAAALTATRRLAVLAMLNLTTGEPEQPEAAEAAGRAGAGGGAEAVRGAGARRPARSCSRRGARCRSGCGPTCSGPCRSWWR